MKKYLQRSCGTDCTMPAYDADRRGSVLLVVIGLLGMLLLLGVAFYSFANSEISSSQYYAEAAKEDDSGLSPDKLWSFALEQLILGTNDTNKQHSALFGRRNALLAGILGRNGGANFDGFDLTPFDGAGINVRYSPAGDPFVDQDFDGAADASQTLLNFNYSWAASGGVAPAIPIAPAIDVDYSSADINSLPLAFVGRGLDGAGNDINVIIPSFHRPQLLRQAGAPIPNWQRNAITSQSILRPHPNHVCVGGVNPRFLDVAATNALGQTVNPFPFGTVATLQQGVWDLTGPPGGAVNYAWDADNDGDGVKEGIWMDLDFPVQTLADGRKYVPLFSFTVLDADGLINLNVSGNQAGLNMPIAGVPLAGGRHISHSNQGLSRAEISPEWAMYADPATDPASTAQHNLFWNTPAGSISRVEMANIETLFLNIGRPEFTDKVGGTYTFSGGPGPYEPSKYYPGRYGELELMARNQYTASKFGMAGIGDGGNREFSLLPQPGRSAQLYGAFGDDDSDGIIGQARLDTGNSYTFTGASFAQMQSNTAIPSFIHPLDYFGDGNSYIGGPTGMRTQLSNSGLTTPMQWPYYAPNGTTYSYSSPGIDGTGSNFPSYATAGAGGMLLPNSRLGVIDEADEIIAEWELATTNATMVQDEILGPDNMLELHATDADLTTATLQARMRNLVPFNFSLAASAEAIRHQFTVLSHDRKNFGLSPLVHRSWEFTTDVDGDGNFEFPPYSLSLAGTSALEPMRQVLRQLLYVELNQATPSTALTQLRLNLNRLLTRYDLVNGPVSSPYGITAPIGAPVYRELTAHPIGLANTPITTAPTWNADTPGGAPTGNDQEYWARVDRQRMARDIYTLLYILGGGMDNINYATTSNATNGLYSIAQLKEMAQFAVNVVDELDRDEVITKFEYDKNLADGWNLDDYPYNSLTDPENSVVDRAVVYGVEAQKLTLSEVLGIISRRVETTPGSMTYTNHAATQVDDTGSSDRFYTYIELQNTSPFNVNLTNGSWQIAVQDDPDGIPNSGDELDRVQLTLINNNAMTGTIAPGAMFTIGTRGGPTAVDPAMPTNNLPSLFKVDTTGSGSPDFTMPTTWIVPASGALDLDLIPTTAGSNNNNAQFLITDGSVTPLTGTDYTTPGTGQDVTTAGSFLSGGAGGNVSTAQESLPHTFVLRRRANPLRAIPVSYTSSAVNHNNQSIDNPWVEVDRITMTSWRDFGLLPSDGMTEVQTKLAPLTSIERSQPFSRTPTGEATHTPVAAAPYRSNTIAAVNSTSPPTFSQLQVHFDRDFASPVDLLSVPLYGPDQVTYRVGQMARFNGDTPATSSLAQERFLRPQAYANLALAIPEATPASPATAVTDTLNNRWYRLLEFTEVPNQTEQGLRVYPYALRNSGAVNLNMIRHRGVLAGIVDDPSVSGGHHNLAYGSEAVMLQDTYEGPVRDWWFQFLRSRDGLDPLTGLILPGTPAGRPFRSLGYSEHSSASLEDTVFRSLPLDVLSGPPFDQYADRRGLFEARASSDRPSQGGGDVVDAASRHRLLRKVVNNTTTRSNVFVVWISTRNFEAIQQANGDITIGDVLQGSPDHRGFFIVDRSLPEAAFQANSGRFDFRKFVQYRKTLQ